MTLCIVCRDTRILLGMKKRGFGEGKWNGFGGKTNPGETVKEAAARELREEANVEAVRMTEVGVLDFVYAEDPDIHEVHIYRVDEYRGEPCETEEMKPEWFDLDKIPFEKMWPDDEFWLAKLLENEKFTGRFVFDEKGNILEKELASVEDLH